MFYNLCYGWLVTANLLGRTAHPRDACVNLPAHDIMRVQILNIFSLFSLHFLILTAL